MREYRHRMQRLPALLVAALVVAALAGQSCGDTSGTVVGGEPANTPGATPNDTKNVNCPASGGPSSGTLSGLGAMIGQFRQAHPQDPKYTSQFGATISGGPNNGLPELTASCTTVGVVVFVTQELAEPMSDAKVKASVLSLGIAPADSQFQSIQTLKPCELFFYKSASLAAAPGTNDTVGTFVVDLIPPGTDWDPANVQTLIYDLDTSGGC
jgi:hypothetical protein